MIKTRVEVNEQGELYTIIPPDVAEEYGFFEGEQIEWDVMDSTLVIISLI